MSTELERTLGLSELARAWARRLQSTVAPHDALVVVGGPASLLGRHFPLDRSAGRITVGRGATAGARGAADPISLDSAFLSAPHAALEAVPEGWQLVDLQSSNHSYVGTVRVERQRLVYGDEVRLGELVLLYISADLERLPSHVVDAASGLLGATVFEAEAARLAASSGGALALLLLHCPGLREQLADQPSPELALLPRRIGAALLAALEGAVLGRLQVDRFAAAWNDDAEAARGKAEEARDSLAALTLGCGLGPPRAVLCRAHRPQRVPALLASAASELEQSGPPLVEAELEAQRPLLGQPQLLAALLAAPELSLLLLVLADEDGLRHRLGHAQLSTCRFRLHRLARRIDPCVAPVVGLLGERVLVLGCAEPGDAARLAEELSRGFQEELRGLPDLAGERLSATLLDAEERRALQRGRDLERLLLEAAEGTSLFGGERLEVEGLPAPLAAPYALIWSLGSEVGRLRAIFQAAEAAARFVACGALSALARWGSVESQARLRPLLVRSRRPTLSLGDWVALLRQLQPELASLDEPLGQLLAGAVTGGGGAPLARLLERDLLPARNAFVHGGAASETWGAARAQALLRELHQLLRALAPLREASLLAVLETRPRRGGGARATVRLLSGPRETFELRQVELRTGAEALFPDSVYLCSEDYRQALELQPLVRLSPCPRCDRDEIFLAEGLPLPGGRLELRAASTGHALRWRPALEELPEGWVRLLADS